MLFIYYFYQTNLIYLIGTLHNCWLTSLMRQHRKMYWILMCEQSIEFISIFMYTKLPPFSHIFPIFYIVHLINCSWTSSTYSGTTYNQTLCLLKFACSFVGSFAERSLQCHKWKHSKLLDLTKLWRSEASFTTTTYNLVLWKWNHLQFLQNAKWVE